MTRSRSSTQLVAAVAGLFFIVFGVLGYLGSVTSPPVHTWTGPVDGWIFGNFEVDRLMNAVHVIFGAFGLILAASPRTSRSYLTAGGILNLGLWAYGVWMVQEGPAIGANIFALSPATNLVHAAAGSLMVLCGVLAPASATVYRRRTVKARSNGPAALA